MLSFYKPKLACNLTVIVWSIYFYDEVDITAVIILLYHLLLYHFNFLKPF